MNIGEIIAAEDGYTCTECGRLIPVGAEPVVAMRAAVDEIEATGDPQYITYAELGIYHTECFHDG